MFCLSMIKLFVFIKDQLTEVHTNKKKINVETERKHLLEGKLKQYTTSLQVTNYKPATTVNNLLFTNNNIKKFKLLHNQK